MNSITSTEATTHRSRLLSVPRLLVVTAVTMVLAFVGQVSAEAALATAYSNGFTCQNTSFAGRRVAANPPQMTSLSGRLETVQWSPDLYRWNGSAWYLYDGSRPWYYAVSNATGTMYNGLLYGTWFSPQNRVLLQAVYDNLPAGHYAVKDYFRWQNGAVRSVWSYYRTSGVSYCTFS